MQHSYTLVPVVVSRVGISRNDILSSDFKFPFLVSRHHRQLSDCPKWSSNTFQIFQVFQIKFLMYPSPSPFFRLFQLVGPSIPSKYYCLPFFCRHHRHFSDCFFWSFITFEIFEILQIAFLMWPSPSTIFRFPFFMFYYLRNIPNISNDLAYSAVNSVNP